VTYLESKVPTTEKLAKALEELNDPKLAGMIKKARDGYYDDFKTPVAFPQIELVKDLIESGYQEMVKRVIDGEFDAQEWEAEEWANSPDGQETFRSLLGDSNV
jgi:transposase